MESLRDKLAAVTEHSDRIESELAKLLALQQEILGAIAQLQEQLDKKIEKWTWDLFKRTDKQIERWTWERYKRIRKHAEEFHRHIDFTYRDIMVTLERQHSYLPHAEIKLITDAPIAYDSLDHLYPYGTIRDNTRHPRFVRKCEELLDRTQNLKFLDLGCSGGGMILEAVLRGHLFLRLEGSDHFLKEQRAEWRLLGDRLRTRDITKPFRVEDAKEEIQQFDIITAWEVMEHIAEDNLPHLFQNILLHLVEGGYFIAFIANRESIESTSGINSHVTMRPYQWRKEQFEIAGFIICLELLQPDDMARRAYNPACCYTTPITEFNAEESSHIVAKKRL